MRKLATAAAVSLALASGGAFGLGLGDIEVQSSLNQAMEAEIPLTSVQPGELNGIIVKLASTDSFVRAGIERSEALESLRFGVDVSSGTATIRVFSTEPISEPFLNFLLEVEWSGGRMVREYTVLLDPPVFMSPSASTRNTAADQLARSESGDSLVTPTPIQRDGGFAVDLGDLEDAAPDDVLSLDNALSGTISGNDGDLVTLDSLSGDDIRAGDVSGNANSDTGDIVSLSDLNAPNTDAIAEREAEAIANLDGFEVEIAGSDEELTDDGSTIVSLADIDASEESALASGDSDREVTVGRGDTLFEIARDTSPANVSVEQMMMALLNANESSFINRNINLVRAGSILRVPERGEVTRLDQTQALAAVSEQNELWQDYRDSLRSTASTQIAQNLTGGNDGELPDNGDVSDAIESAAIDSGTSIAGLSEEAQAILDQARNEVYNREELRIVADENSGNSSASATTDELNNNDAASVGEVNRRLQLAREELAATRMRTSDLSEQAGELENTGENLDAMVSLRQNEIARLEAQLEKVRLAEEEGAAEGGDDAMATDALELAGNDVEDAAGELADIADTAEAAAGSVTDAAADAADGVADNASELADAAADTLAESQEEMAEQGNEAVEAAGEAAQSIADAADEEVESTDNALTEAGETLGEVEAYSEDGDAQAVASAEQAELDAQVAEQADSGAWYQNIMQNPTYLAVGGLGLLALLGAAGTLLFRRKRGGTDDDTLDGFEEAGFGDDAAGTAGVAGAAAGLDRFDEAGATDAFDASNVDGFNDLDGTGGQGFDGNSLAADNTGAFNATSDEEVINLPGPKTGIEDDSLDKDDTISEADVYIAYGLHGQAEELLTKAIERKPDNPDYTYKLLQTYHAQGNEDAFHDTAAGFHQRFGGESNPDWNAISTMGSDLTPGHVLYTGSGENSVDTPDVADLMDADDLDSSMTGNNESDSDATDNDFLTAGVGAAAAAGAGSFSRNFANAKDNDEHDGDDSLIIDDSLDPAFAFDESDLEATGDFTELADELAAENEALSDYDSLDDSLLDGTALEDSSLDDSGIDFTSIDGVNSAANETLQMDELTVGDSSLDEAMDADQLDDMNTSVEDLTLDLDQLSGELELDSADMMGTDLSDLDIPELTAENELLLDSSGVLGDGSDEMETMLDLAKAYIDMGDRDSASSTLSEIVKGGSPEQVTEAETLLSKIS